MRDHCMVVVYHRSLCGGCILAIIVWWLYMSDHCMVAVYEDHCMVAVYERSMYGGCRSLYDGCI